MNPKFSLLLLLSLTHLSGCVHREHFRPVHHARTHFAAAVGCDRDDIAVSPLALPFHADPYYRDHRTYRVRGCGQEVDVECAGFGSAHDASCFVVQPYETPLQNNTAVVRVVTEYSQPRTAREVLHLGVDGRVVRPSNAPAVGLPVTAEPGTYSFESALLESYLEYRTRYRTWSCGTNLRCSGPVTTAHRRTRLASPCSASVRFHPQPGASYRFVVRHQASGLCDVQCVRDDGGLDRACEMTRGG